MKEIRHKVEVEIGSHDEGTYVTLQTVAYLPVPNSESRHPGPLFVHALGNMKSTTTTSCRVLKALALNRS